MNGRTSSARNDHVLPGKDGWFFLGEGTNFSLSQITGTLHPSPSTQAQWLRTLKVRADVLGDRVISVVCPEKSCIYPEYLPDGHVISDMRFAKVLERQAPRFLYALSDMVSIDATNLLYPKTDTHFTEFGAHCVAKSICERLGIAYPDLSPEWEVREQLGDLGSVWNPQVRSENVVMKNPPALKVRDNGVQNRGRVTRYEGGGAHILLFGDSFAGIALARQIAVVAGSVTFVHSLGFDYELIQRLKPDFVVGEMAERFLLEPPNEGRSLASLIMEKKVQGLYSARMVASFRQSLSEFEDVYGPAVEYLRHIFEDSE